nr:immunoglobulin heavy chain junction region [Macaca mulatta]MOV47448.1 immunoglobulin heavy chain junction region [Macaca mulatta]MOV47526.1 immunoglobulin heavy chain junction region [Macaca mulatta]MOV47534.1 immunoglobulin heavy chain junction region [Macaca mulatta]MOV47544.1 immunoglobulin heavy chain junction region [Macaca mulatta]
CARVHCAGAVCLGEMDWYFDLW